MQILNPTKLFKKNINLFFEGLFSYFIADFLTLNSELPTCNLQCFSLKAGAKVDTFLL